MNNTIAYYTLDQDPSDKSVPGVDLVVILGNAVNGSDWDGQDPSYFEDRWDQIMAVAIEN